jgi:RNA recognition motif-containing protein
MQSTKLYVGNLVYDATTQDVEDLFSSYGTVMSTKLIEGKGFGFVEMSTQEEAENAKEKLDGYEFKGRTLRVAEARPQRERERRGGGGGGGGDRFNRGGKREGFGRGRRF